MEKTTTSKNEETNQERRDFLKVTSLALAGAAIGMPAYSYNRIQGSNDRVRVGLVGFSDRAKFSLIPSFQASSKDLNMEIGAISDIWNVRRQEGETFLKSQNPKAKIDLFRNNEELYAKGKVDAVIISTADFQHAYHGIEAVTAGVDAYVEKPMANTMADARDLLAAVKKTGKVVQIGTQRRSGENYMLANQYLKEGKFGNPVAVEMSWNVNQPGRWRRPALVSSIKEADTDWRRFLINRPFEAWDPRKYLEYRLFWPYSSGIPDQWMVHQIDTVHWFTGLARPRSVVANGGIYQWPDGRKNMDTMTAVFNYGPLDKEEGGFQVVYSSRMTNSAGGIKEIYFSNGGSLNLDTNKITASGGLDLNAAKAMGLPANQLAEFDLAPPAKVESGANTGSDSVTMAHVRNWMECIRSRKAPNADVTAGYNHSVALCMTIAALQTGKKITFDDAKQEVIIL
jgi:predicted dehydrogenase